jgi:hypothetical protein
MVWQECDAAERFEEFYNAAVKAAPRTLSRRGVEVAVFVSIEEWNTLKAKSQNTTGIPDSQEKA